MAATSVKSHSACSLCLPERPSAPLVRHKGRMVTSSVDSAVGTLYSEHVNPQWVRLLDLLEMNVSYERCLGTELFAADGRRILDFLSGYCVHHVGHNHPAVISALHDELDLTGPAMVQNHVAERAAELAEKLCQPAGGKLTKVFFASSG